LLGAAATGVVAFVPAVRFAYKAEQLHIAIETTASLVAIVVAFLIGGRLRRSGRLDDLLLAAAVGLLAVTNTVFALLPAIVARPSSGFVGWAGIGGHAAAALLIAAAAFAPFGQCRTVGVHAVARAVALVALLVLVDSVVMAALRDRLPRPVLVTHPNVSGRPQIVGDTSVLAIQLVSACLYALASVGFARRATLRRDAFMTFLAAGAALAALARVNYFLYPSFYSHWVYAGDFFRLAFYLVLFAGALREIGDYFRAARERAVLEERRRLARDLHDGLAQELAYISRVSKVVSPAATPDVIGDLQAATERALQQSRQAVAALATPITEPLEEIIVRVATETGARYGVDVDVDVAAELDLDEPRADALVRIAGEAVSNAARHSGARRVRVVVEWRRGRPRLRVIDRGRGFEPPPPGVRTVTYGLTSMRERAAAVGADFTIRSKLGAGTCVEVSL
jgi:signal transduction histidine kinase